MKELKTTIIGLALTAIVVGALVWVGNTRLTSAEYTGTCPVAGARCSGTMDGHVIGCHFTKENAYLMSHN